MTIEIKWVKVGSLRTNTYCIIDSGEAIIIDPGAPDSRILECIPPDVEVKAIIATHGHFDHVLGVPYIKKHYDAPFYIHPDDIEIMRYSLTHFGYSFFDADKYLSEATVFRIGKLELRVLHTPGHTPGSICLYSIPERIVFTGDTLFKGAIGRTDFYGGDPLKIFDSLKKLFELLPDDTVVYPGHGKTTSIGTEKRNLPIR